MTIIGLAQFQKDRHGQASETRRGNHVDHRHTSADWQAVVLQRHPTRNTAPALDSKRQLGAHTPRHLVDRGATVLAVRRCLIEVCDTGASDASIDDARSLISQLHAGRTTAAHSLAATLSGALSYLDADYRGHDGHPRRRSIHGFSGISTDLIDRAAAAYDTRASRKPDEIVLSFAGDCSFGSVNGDAGGGRFPSVYRRSGRLDYPFALVRPWFA